MAELLMRDVTAQREATVSDNHSTVGDLVSAATRALRLPTQSARGLQLDYSIRTAGGHMLRPSESLQDEGVRRLLQEGANAVLPRLTAAGA